MLDLLVTNATLPDGRTGMSVAVQDGRIVVAFGQDCCMDPWYSLDSGDMLAVAHMGLHVAQMTGQAAIRQCFEAVTTHPARILHLDGYGIVPGGHADFVPLHAKDAVEAIRLRATRLKVYRRGRLLAQTPAPVAELRVEGRPGVVSGLQVR